MIPCFMKFNKFIDTVYLPYVHTTFELSTYDNYVRFLRIIKQELGDIRLGFIRKKHLIQFFDNAEKRGIAKTTMVEYKKLLSAIFNYAIKNKNIKRNPVKGISIKKTKSRAAIYTPEEVEILLNFIKEKFALVYLPVFLAVNTGMRRGEILGLTWDKINFDKKEIIINKSLVRTSSGKIYFKEPKTASGMRTIAISDEVVEFLKEIYENSESKYVVAGWNRGYMDPQYLTNKFSKAVNESEVPKRRFHDLRHTHASLLLAAGESIKLVSERLGHANIDITLKTYAHLLPNQQHEAAEKVACIFRKAKEKLKGH